MEKFIELRSEEGESFFINIDKISCLRFDRENNLIISFVDNARIKCSLMKSDRAKLSTILDKMTFNEWINVKCGGD